MNDIIVKIEELCFQIDNYLPYIKDDNNIIDAIYKYLTNNDITIIYPNTYVQAYSDFISFFNRLKKSLDEVYNIEYNDKKLYILNYFRDILFNIDLSVIR